jgi:predicted ATPase
MTRADSDASLSSRAARACCFGADGRPPLTVTADNESARQDNNGNPRKIMRRLIAIELENFQSIAEPVRIEFSPITLFFGPNSAGKSAISRALLLARAFWDTQRNTEKDVASMLQRWSRTQPNNAKGDVNERVKTRIAIEFEYEQTSITGDQALRSPMGFGSHLYLDDDPWEGVPQVCTLSVEFHRFGSTLQIGEIRVNLGASPVFAIAITDNIPDGLGDEYRTDRDGFDRHGLNTEIHYAIIYPREDIYFWDTPQAPTKVKANPRENPDAGMYSSKWAKDTEGRFFNIFTFDEFHASHDQTLIPDLTRIPLARYPDNKNYRDQIVELLQYLCDQFQALLDSSPDLVRADRSVPPPQELTYLVYPQTATIDSCALRSKPLTPYSAEIISYALRSRGLSDYLDRSRLAGDPSYRPIAECAYEAELDSYTTLSGSTLNRDKERATISQARTSRMRRMNEYLSENLFIEKLYKIVADVCFLSPLGFTKENEYDEPRIEHMALSEPALVSVLLMDGEGRRIEIQDVGSGIGFVLPVLHAAACGNIVQVQQPELHLHPALQGALADVFIRSTMEVPSSTTILETHSEHLILRFLRRIRENLSAASHTTFSEEQLAVYYFEPQPASGTRVLKIPVSPMGDFLLPWPGGFFADREKDLFDV